MAALLHSLCGDDRLAECARNEMSAFVVIIGPREAPRLRLDVMATSADAAKQQHECLAHEGERVEVTPRPPMFSDLQISVDDMRRAGWL